MAVNRPGLLGQDTSLGGRTRGAFGGFEDAGIQQLTSAFENTISRVRADKVRKYDQQKALRDGIVSGHISTEVAEQVEGYISQMSGMNPNSKEYYDMLNKATANLNISVQDQAKGTKIVDTAVTGVAEAEDAKYYKTDDFKAGIQTYIEENKSVGEDGIARMNIDGKSVGEYTSNWKQDVNNINQDLVREDFGKVLGTIEISGASTGEGQLESGLLTTTATSSTKSYKAGYKYDPKLKMSVPIFQDNGSDVPNEFVEKWATSSPAAMAMMDDYVSKQLAGQTFEGENADETRQRAEMDARKKFIVEQMKQIVPDYSSSYTKQERVISGQTGGGGGKTDKPNPSSLIVTQVGRAMYGDESVVGGDTPTTTFQFGNEQLEGYDLTQKFKDVNFSMVGEMGQKASRIFKPEGENALYITDHTGSTQKYSPEEFNSLVLKLSQADNGFDLEDANSLTEYDRTNKNFVLEQSYQDSKGNVKKQSQMTPEDFASGDFSPLGKSILGSGFKQSVPLTAAQKEQQLIKGVQQKAGSALTQIGINFEDFDNEYMSGATSSGRKKVNAALSTALTGTIVPGISKTDTITSIEPGYRFGSGIGKFVITLSDGSEVVKDANQMRMILGLEQPTD